VTLTHSKSCKQETREEERVVIDLRPSTVRAHFNHSTVWGKRRGGDRPLGAFKLASIKVDAAEIEEARFTGSDLM
jgi:hypothetical protein